MTFNRTKGIIILSISLGILVALFYAYNYTTENKEFEREKAIGMRKLSPDEPLRPVKQHLGRLQIRKSINDYKGDRLLLGGERSYLEAKDVPAAWKTEWPKTDFTKMEVPVTDIISGGPPKDGIPAIDNPTFIPVKKVTNLSDQEPVISISIGGKARAYPIRILMFHEIVNDTLSGVPIAVTYCPLCNSSIVFERTLAGKVLDFGTTGKLRFSDMIMYDRQTESWWQQFLGEGIVGQHTGTRLKQLPARIESFALFKSRYPQGEVLVPNNPQARPYGDNPYVNYDSAKVPFLFAGPIEGPIPPLARVVAVGKHAWPLSLVREKKRIEFEGLVLIWQEGQASPLDHSKIAKGKEIGNVTVTRVDT